MSYKAVIHLPKAQKDMESLLHEIALFRSKKTLRLLGEQGVTPEQLTEILRNLDAAAENKQGK